MKQSTLSKTAVKLSYNRQGRRVHLVNDINGVNHIYQGHPHETSIPLFPIAF